MWGPACGPLGRPDALPSPPRPQATRARAARALGVKPDAGILAWPSSFRRCQSLHDGMRHVADVTSGASATMMMAQVMMASCC